MKDSGIGSIDLIIILAYIIGILAIGLLSVRKKKMTSINYFLAEWSSKWPIVGAALFASNISTIHMVGLAASGYSEGWVWGNFEWMVFLHYSADTYIRAVLFQNPNCYASSIPGKTIWTRIKNICCFYGNRYRWTKIGYVNRNGTNDYSYFRRCITYHFSHS
jgi:hypothetical protein